MKKVFQVEWTHGAELDLEIIIDFIAESHPQNAGRLLEKIRNKAKTLKSHPHRGRQLPELAHIQGLPFRELVLKPWRLIYEIRGSTVAILAFFDARRDLEEVLYERLTRFVQ